MLVLAVLFRISASFTSSFHFIFLSRRVILTSFDARPLHSRPSLPTDKALRSVILISFMCVVRHYEHAHGTIASKATHYNTNNNNKTTRFRYSKSLCVVVGVVYLNDNRKYIPSRKSVPATIYLVVVCTVVLLEHITTQESITTYTGIE